MGARVSRDARGVWFCRPYLGRDATGHAIRPFRSFPGAATESEAQAQADAWVANLTGDGTVRSALLPDLLDGYNDMRERNGASPNSVRQYRSFVANHVRPRLGRTVARDLTAADMVAFEQALLAPSDAGGDGLSRNSVLAHHHYLRAAFSFLVASGLCDANPMLSVQPPSPDRGEAAAIGEWDLPRVASALLSSIGSGEGEEWLEASVPAIGAWLSLVTGMRVGEVCAVRRMDVSRSALSVRVGGTVVEQRGREPWRRPVTKGRRPRTVSVTAADMRVIDSIVTRQDAVFGPVGHECALVSSDGNFVRPTYLSRVFRDIRDGLGLPRSLTFHSLRHTHATWCLARGVDARTLSERLGHADVATTLRIYAHVMPGRDAAAARAFEEAVGVPRAGIGCDGGDGGHDGGDRRGVGR